MNMIKNIMYAVVTVVALVILWRLLDKDKHMTRAVENTVESASLSIEERSLPGEGDTSQNAVIRKAMLEQRERDNREWTAANRQAHPDLYLEHCGKMLTDFLNKYESAILEVKTTVNLYRREIERANEDSGPLLGFLKEAKRVLSDEKHVYPAKVGVYTYKDIDILKSAVISTDEKLSESETLVQQRKGQLEQLQKTLSDLVRGRDRVKKELSDLDQIKAQAKTDMLQKSVDELHTRMDSLISGIDVISNGIETKPGFVQENKEKSVDDVFNRRGIN